MIKSSCAIVLLLCVFSAAQAQSRKEKKAFAEKQQQYAKVLRQDVEVLAADSLEGRRAGTVGEQKALNYLVKRWKEIGLAPAGTAGTYTQPFYIPQGLQLQPGENHLRINGKALLLHEEYYPMSWSARQAKLTAHAALSLPESGLPWFVNVKEWMDENAQNPHYNLAAAVVQEAQRARKKGATALLVYNSGTGTDNLLFAKFDTLQCDFPVLYLTQKGMAHLADATASYHIEMMTSMKPAYRMATNVVAFIDNKAASTIVLGAHYDHLGYGEDKNSLDGEGQIHNGADDNASGTAALTLLGAELLNNAATRGHNYLLIAFSAEELGLLGSRHWVDSPTISTRVAAMINMDMVGRYSPEKKLTVGGYGTSPVWASAVEKANVPMLNLQIQIDSSGSGPSDHASFYRKQMPVLFLFTNSHADYHKASDDAALVNYAGTAGIVTFALNVLTHLSGVETIPFTATKEKNMGRSTGFTVSLGVIPDYAYSGSGVKIDGVSKGKVAEKLGLQSGDVLVQLGEHRFVDVQGYMQVLSKFKKGDATTLIIRRGSTELSFPLVF